MKKILTSVGLVAIGATSLQAAYTPNLSSMEKQKPWSVSGSLRGFYDDNYTTAPAAASRESFGFEVSPSASLNLPLDQTFIGLSYVYSLRYYEDRVNNKEDQSHQFKGRLDHAFSERYKLAVTESFVIAQEPELLDPGAPGVRTRTDGDNMRNTASINFSAQLTQLFGVEVGYQNTILDYDQDNGPGSRSDILDRMEHLVSLNLRWQAQPQTVAILGYQYGLTDYTGDLLAVGFPSDSRNARSHYLYVGADQNFNSKLNGSIRVGGQYTEYYNSVSDKDTISPYADVKLAYSYAPGSYAQVGVMHSRNSTDVYGSTAADPTFDQEYTSVYGSINHKISASFNGSLLASYQNSSFEGGTADGEGENFLTLGASLSYKIDKAGHWLAETGYNFDRLDSDLGGRAYTRNRVYVGIRGTY